MKRRQFFRYAKFTGLGLILGLTALAATASAQDGGAQLYVQAPTGVEIKEGGADIQVDVLASGVSNLAAFQFSLQYNPSILRYVNVKETTFLGSTGRPVECPEPRQEQDSKKVERIRFACATLASPVSLGGKAGPNGAGTLAQVTFAPVGGGNTPLDLADVILVAAEIDAEGNPVQISSSMQGSSLDVIGSGGSSLWLILGATLAGIVVVGLVGGGVLLSRRRGR